MCRRRRALFEFWTLRFVLIGLLVSPVVVRGHHSVLAFDNSRQTTVRGMVRDVVWGYPHVYLSVDVGEEAGAMIRWLVEIESPAVLERLGWTRESVRPGDRIRTSGARARNGSRRLRCDAVETAAGSRLPCYPRLSPVAG